MFNLPENANLDIANILETMKQFYDTCHSEIDNSDFSDKLKKLMKKQQMFHERSTKELTKCLFNAFNGVLIQHRDAYDLVNRDLEEARTSRDNYKQELIMTKIEIDRQQQRQKCDTLRIHNIAIPELPAREQENVAKTVTEYLKEANMNIEQESIKSAFRPLKDGVKSNNVIVTLLRSTDKLKILRQRKTNMADNAEFRNKRPNSFVTEDLTPLRQLISYKLRQDKQRIRISWSMDGKIKCLKTGQEDGTRKK